MANCTYRRPGASPAGTGVRKGGRYFREGPAIAPAGTSPIYLSDWLSNRLIKRYLEAFTDETWPAVVRWTFVLGVLALRNGGFSSQCLSLADLKAIAKQNSDELSTLPRRERARRMTEGRDGSSDGKRKSDGVVSLLSGANSVTAAAKKLKERTTAASTIIHKNGEGAEVVPGDAAKLAAAAANIDIREVISSGAVRGNKGGREDKEAENEERADLPRGRGAAHKEETDTLTRRALSSAPISRMRTRRHFSADESRRHWSCQEFSPSSPWPQYYRQQVSSTLQKPSSRWRSGDPVTFTPLRGPYRSERLPLPQRFSRHAERTYPLWWGDCFVAAPENSLPLSGATTAQGCYCCPRSTSSDDAKRGDTNVLQSSNPARQSNEEGVKNAFGANVSLPPFVQSKEQRQPGNTAQTQHRPRTCRLKGETPEEATPTFCGEGYSLKGNLNDQELRTKEEEDAEQTTVATLAATPKFGAPAPSVAVFACEAAGSIEKLELRSKAGSICHPRVPSACSRDEDVQGSPQCGSASVASPVSVAGLLQDMKHSGKHERQASLGQMEPQCHRTQTQQQQRLPRKCVKQQTVQARDRFVLGSGLQQQQRLKQRSLHRSVAVPPSVVVDGFQSFRPAGEAQWICTLRPAAHRHVRPQPTVAAPSRRRQPILPPIALQTSSAGGRSSSGKRGQITQHRAMRQQQSYLQKLSQAELLPTQLPTHRAAHPAVVECSFPNSDSGRRKTGGLQRTDELFRGTIPSQGMHEPPRGIVNSHACNTGLGRAATPAVEPQHTGRLAAAVSVARAAALDSACAFHAAAPAAPEERFTMHRTSAPGSESYETKPKEPNAPLLRDSTGNPGVCTYSSFFDAALAAYTNSDALRYRHDTLVEPRLQRPPQGVPASLCLDDDNNAAPDNCSSVDDTIPAPEELHAAPEDHLCHRDYATDVANCASRRRCSTSSSFSLSSLSVAENSACASSDGQSSSAYPASGETADEHDNRFAQHLSQQPETHIDEAQQIRNELQFLSQRARTKHHETGREVPGDFDEHEEVHKAAWPSVRQPASEDPGPDHSYYNEDEAATVKELLQLYFPTDTEKPAILQDRCSCDVPVLVEAGWKRKQFLQKSF